MKAAAAIGPLICMFALSLRAQTPEALTAKGIEFLQTGNYVEAERQFSQALHANPELIDAQNLRGIALDQQGKHAEARECFLKAIRQQSSYAPAHANLALNAVQLADYRLAATELQKALKLDPHPENEAELRYDLALSLFHIGEYEQSLQVLNKIDNSARDASYFALTGADDRELEHSLEAKNNLERAVAMEPANCSYLYDLAIAMIQNSSAPEAISRINGGLPVCSNQAELHAALGVAYYASGQNKEAETNYEAAVALEPNDANLRGALGDLYVAADDHERASAEYQRALEFDPHNASYLLKQGINWMKLQQLDRAESAFRKVLAINPKSVDAYLNLGRLALQRGKSDEAVHDLEQSVALQPDSSGAWYQLALTYKRTGQADKSAAALKRFRTLTAPNQDLP